MLIINDGELLLSLKELYDFESPRVSGAHGGIPKFNPWSKDEVLADTNITEENFEELIKLLKEKNQVICIPAYADFPNRYQTRTAEMVRTLGTMHEYVYRQTEVGSDERQHLQIIEATKWIPALLERPDRVVSIPEFLENLRFDIENRRISRVGSLSIDNVIELVQLTMIAIGRYTFESSDENKKKYTVSEVIEKFRITKFQDRAIKQALLSSFSTEKENKARIK